MSANFSPQKMPLRIAQGDACGSGYEFRYPNLSDYQNISLDNYIKSAYPDSLNPKHINHFPGMYTDDTRMSIAAIELLLSDKKFTKENLADKFVECYKRDMILGYARGFQKFLDSVNSGKEFIDKINPDSRRNGAAMRAVPIGLVYDIEEVIEYATINAQLTHDTPKGIASSVAVALMSHLSFYGGLHQYNDERLDKDIIKFAVIRHVKDIDNDTGTYLNNVLYINKFDPVLLFGRKHSTKGVPCDGMRTAGAALYLVTRFNSPRDILQEAIKLGGDTDSVASISLGIESLHESIDDLPEFLYRDLTNHKYGRDYLLSLGKKLAEKFPQP